MTSAFKFGENIGVVLVNPRYYLTIAGGAIVSLFTLSWLIKKIKKHLKASEWEKQASIVRRDRDVKIESFLREHRDFKLTDERKKYIIGLTCVKLVENIRNKKISAVEALLSYIYRAATIGKELNLIADINFESALRQAEEIDIRIHQNRITEDLHLLGLPISIKDHIAVKGALQTAGFTSQTSYLVGSDSDIVSVLRSKGAIPFVLSNVPQGILAYETSNKLWGTALNPWNRKKTTGGSSGGEAGLVASRCSPIGIGSDILGSIRLPAAFCGVYGFKPTLKRVSLQGVYNNVPGFTEVQYSLGPIARSVDDLVLIERSLFGNFNDNNVFNIPFNEVLFNDDRKIKIAYMVDSFFDTAPAIKIIVTDIVEKLLKKGYDLIPIRFDTVRELIEVGSSLVNNSEGIENIERTLKGESSGNYYNSLISLRHSSSCTISIMSMFKNMIGEHRMSKMTQTFYKLSRTEYLDKIAKFQKLKADYIKYLKANRIEAIICPVFPTPATNIGSGLELSHFNQFLTLFNYLDMPAGTVPICLNTSLEYSSKINDSLSTYLTGVMKDSVNLPIAIQVSSLPNQDEVCLRIMKEVDSFYSFDVNIGSSVIDKLDISLIINDKIVLTNLDK